MKVSYGLKYRGHAGHPTESPWSKRTDKIIFPRFKFCRATDSWTDLVTYHIWIHHRWGSSFVKMVV